MIHECVKTFVVEDMCCDCEERKIFKMYQRVRQRSHRDWKFHIFVITAVLVVICSARVSSNSIPSVDANSISERKAESPLSRFDSFENDEDDDEEEPSDEESDYGASSAEVFKYYEQQSRNYSKTTPKTSNTPHAALPTSTIEPKSCSGSCLDRQALENAALDSFKKHLLTKLGMENMPNVTKAQKLPEKMLEDICIGMKLPPDYCTGKPPRNNYEYQSDGPGSFDEFDTDVIEEEEDVQYMSAESRIYAFPSAAVKARHKWHLIFAFTENQESNNAVLQATLHLFVHSRKYLIANEIEHPPNLKFIDIEIAKVLKGAQHKMIFDVFHNISIPESGDGRYVQLNITDLVTEWFHNHDTSHGIVVKIMSPQTGAQLSHQIVTLNADDLIRRPYIDILPKDQRKKRTKRSSLKCSKESNEKRCCRHPLTVDFERFGWDWVIAPKKYDANYCAGECKIAFMQRYAHTHVVQLSTAANPCCSPRKMSSIELLYFDEKLNIVLSKIPHMIVEDCFCA